MKGFTKDVLNGFSVGVLKNIALYYNLGIKGKKEDIIERILIYQINNIVDDSEEEPPMSVRIRRIKQSLEEQNG